MPLAVQLFKVPQIYNHIFYRHISMPETLCNGSNIFPSFTRKRLRLGFNLHAQHLF
jgi:hypothetical protein